MYGVGAVRRGEINTVLEHAHKVDDYFLAQKIFPVLGRKLRSGTYPVIKKASGQLLRRDATERNSTGSYNETGSAHEWESYACKDRGLEGRVDDSKASEMSDFFSLEKMVGGNVRRKVALDLEVTAKETLIDTDVFDVTAPSVDYTVANIDTVDCPRDIQVALEAIVGRGEVANSMVMSLNLFNYLRRTKQMQAYVWGKISDSSGKKQITPKMFMEAFDIETLHIAKSSIDGSKTTSKTIINPIWGADHIWVGCIKGGEFENGGVGRTLVWDADSPGGLFTTETYRDETRRSDMMRVRSNSIEKIIDENCGQLIQTNAPAKF